MKVTKNRKKLAAASAVACLLAITASALAFSVYISCNLPPMSHIAVGAPYYISASVLTDASDGQPIVEHGTMLFSRIDYGPWTEKAGGSWRQVWEVVNEAPVTSVSWQVQAAGQFGPTLQARVVTSDYTCGPYASP